MVRRERARGGAAGDVMHHRRFDFEEATRVQPVADFADDLRTRDEHLARLRGHDQVDVALAIALFDVGKPVELVRQRSQRLHQQAQLVGLDRQFAGPGAHQPAFDGHDVADVPALERVVGLAQRGRLQEQLDASAHVLHGGERSLAHHALGEQATGDGDAATRGFQRLARPFFRIREFGLQVAGIVVAAEIVGEGDALPAQRRELAATFGDEPVFVGDVLVDGLNGVVGHGESFRRSGLQPRQISRGAVAAVSRAHKDITPHRCVSRRLPAPTSGWLPRIRRGRRPAPSACRSARHRCAGP